MRERYFPYSALEVVLAGMALTMALELYGRFETGAWRGWESNLRAVLLFSVLCAIIPALMRVADDVLTFVFSPITKLKNRFVGRGWALNALYYGGCIVLIALFVTAHPSASA